MCEVGFEPTKPKHRILRPTPLTARELTRRITFSDTDIDVYFLDFLDFFLGSSGNGEVIASFSNSGNGVTGFSSSTFSRA